MKLLKNIYNLILVFFVSIYVIIKMYPKTFWGSKEEKKKKNERRNNTTTRNQRMES